MRRQTTSTVQRLTGKEATDNKPHVWNGEKNRESFTAFKMELQSWAASLHDKMLKVEEIAESRAGRLRELDVKNAGMSHVDEEAKIMALK